MICFCWYDFMSSRPFVDFLNLFQVFCVLGRKTDIYALHKMMVHAPKTIETSQKVVKIDTKILTQDQLHVSALAIFMFFMTMVRWRSLIIEKCLFQIVRHILYQLQLAISQLQLTFYKWIMPKRARGFILKKSIKAKYLLFWRLISRTPWKFIFQL